MPSPADRRSIGNEAEDLAAKYLRDQGYVIITRGFTRKGGEIDLVAVDGNELVFIEVKFRSQNDSPPEEAMGSQKLASLRKVIAIYLAEAGEPERSYRIDLIAIQGTEIRHHQRIDQD